jgi:hypothetical protein
VTRRPALVTCSIAAALAVLALGACGGKKHDSAAGAPSNAAPAAPSRDLAVFKSLTADSKLSDVRRLAGPPDGDVGSGLHIYIWKLADGSTIRIGTPDNDRLFYVDLKKADGTTTRLVGAGGSHR